MFRNLLLALLSALLIVVSCKKDDNDDNNVVDPDNENPSVYLQFEGMGGQIVQFDTVWLRAQANDNDGVIQKVKFFRGETLIGEDSEVPFLCSWISTDPGEYTFSAVAYDDDGAWTQSSALDLMVLSGTIPHIYIDEPHSGIYFKEGSSVPIITNAWDYDGEIQKIEVYFNDVLLNTHYNVDITYDTVHNITLGDFTIKAIAFDDDGNISEPHEISLEVSPNNPPLAEISTYYTLDNLWQGGSVRFDVTVNDYDGQVVKIELYANETMVTADSTSTYFHDIYWSDMEAGTFDIQLRAYDNSGGIGYSNVISATVGNRLAVNGKVVCFEWGGSPDVMYAMVSESNELLKINPQTRELINSYNMPHSHGLRMQYNEIDDKLYMVSYYTGAVTVFNVSSGNFTDLNFSTTADGRDISISPERRRIYVAASDGMYIMNMDNGTVLAEDHTEECESIAGMHNKEKIMINFNTYFNSLQRYSVAGDVFTMEEQNEEGNNDCSKMLIPTDDSKLIYPCMGYSSTITALDPLNLQNVLGVFESGNTRDFCISKDANYFYMLGWEGISIFNAQTYVKLDESEFGIPNITDFHNTIGLNSDGSVITVFTYDDYYEEEYYIYFLQKDW
jgi:hypothetical protein